MFSRNTTKSTSCGRDALERAQPLVEQAAPAGSSRRGRARSAARAGCPRRAGCRARAGPPWRRAGSRRSPACSIAARPGGQRDARSPGSDRRPSRTAVSAIAAARRPRDRLSARLTASRDDLARRCRRRARPRCAAERSRDALRARVRPPRPGPVHAEADESFGRVFTTSQGSSPAGHEGLVPLVGHAVEHAEGEHADAAGDAEAAGLPPARGTPANERTRYTMPCDEPVRHVVAGRIRSCDDAAKITSIQTATGTPGEERPPARLGGERAYHASRRPARDHDEAANAQQPEADALRRARRAAAAANTVETRAENRSR